MAYCTLDDIKNVIPEKELAQLTVDNAAQPYSVDMQRLNGVISFGDEVINGYLRNRYAVPLSEAPEIIRNISVDIAVYRLHLRRPQKISEAIENGYKNAIKLLEQIQKGSIDLGIREPSQPDTQKSSYYSVTSSAQTFSKEVLDKF